MPQPLRLSFARWIRDTRADLDITQQQLAEAVGLSRSLIAAFESGRANPSLATVDRVGRALGVDFRLEGRPPFRIGGARPRDLVHARCSGYVQRRLTAAGFEVLREVECGAGRVRGWIDLLAYDPRRRLVLIVEVKTSLDDIGAVERQLGWYEREFSGVAARHGWDPVTHATWLLLLATAHNDAVIRDQGDILRVAFPVRAAAMRAVVDGTSLDAPEGRGLALIDPSSRRRSWLIATRSDGRRTIAPYLDLGAAARHLDPGGQSR